MNDIQAQLRQWSGSTLHKMHRETGESAAQRIDQLESQAEALKAALKEACEWNWIDHESAFLELPVDVDSLVPSHVCRRIFLALIGGAVDDS